MIVLSMLGTSKYGPIAYVWGQRQTSHHPFVQCALAEWFPDAEILVGVTKEAREKQGQAILEAIPSARLVDIPSGKNEEEYWELFGIIEKHIPTGSELVLDITHGFRSLPVLALLTVSFLQAAKGVRLKHVLYGACEAKSGDVAPVFDLTRFVTMLDWAGATNRFLETGDASKFRPLVETRGAKPLNTDLNAGVKLLEELSSALATNRARESGEKAFKAKKRLAKAKQRKWEAAHAPLKLLLEPLQSGLETLQLDTARSQKKQLVQLFRQVLWYRSNNQYEKAVGLAREWMVSYAVLDQEGQWLPVDNSIRKKKERWLGKCVNDSGSIPTGWGKFIAIWRDLGDLRNDLMHFGFRDSPRPASVIPDEVSRKLKQLHTTVQELGLELPEPQ